MNRSIANAGHSFSSVFLGLQGFSRCSNSSVLQFHLLMHSSAKHLHQYYPDHWLRPPSTAYKQGEHRRAHTKQNCIILRLQPSSTIAHSVADANPLLAAEMGRMRVDTQLRRVTQISGGGNRNGRNKTEERHQTLAFAGTTRQVCTCPQTPCILEGVELTNTRLLRRTQQAGINGRARNTNTSHQRHK